MYRHTLATSANLDQQDAVLTKAIVRLASTYGLKGKELSQIIGISEASATRLSKSERLISEKTKEGELALLLIRLYRSLNALVGDEPAKAKAWLESPNHYFSTIPPIECIKSVEGLIEVVNYLDAMRGKI
jgi:uncharacterized protein (DUF2384 family)